MPSRVDVKRMAESILDLYPDLCLTTPCGVLAPLLEALETVHPRFSIVHREDNALALATGAAMAGKRPAVLVQNSGFGQSVNVLASLVEAFAVPIGLIVSMRGTGADHTRENQGMGMATVPVLETLGLDWKYLEPADWKESLAWLSSAGQHKPAVLLAPPDSFGWSPA
jgi:sulfopyruvate decarboxylase TPP-binding subunit